MITIFFIMAIKWSTKCSDLAEVINAEVLVPNAENNKSSDLIIRYSFHIKMNCSLEMDPLEESVSNWLFALGVMFYCCNDSNIFALGVMSIKLFAFGGTCIVDHLCHVSVLGAACQSQQWHLPMSTMGRSESHATVCHSCSSTLHCWCPSSSHSFPSSPLFCPSKLERILPSAPPILLLDPPNVLAWIEQLVDLQGQHGRTVANQSDHRQRHDGLIVVEFVGRMNAWDDLGGVVIMMMVVMIVVVVIHRGKGIIKHLLQAKTMTAAQTVAMGIALEISSWARQLQRSMAMLLQGWR